jgi:hypothetical protein
MSSAILEKENYLLDLLHDLDESIVKAPEKKQKILQGASTSSLNRAELQKLPMKKNVRDAQCIICASQKRLENPVQ